MSRFVVVPCDEYWIAASVVDVERGERRVCGTSSLAHARVICRALNALPDVASIIEAEEAIEAAEEAEQTRLWEIEKARRIAAYDAETAGVRAARDARLEAGLAAIQARSDEMARLAR